MEPLKCGHADEAENPPAEPIDGTKDGFAVGDVG